MIKSAVNEFMPVYPKLFNTVLKSGIMPQTWCNGIITPIFKRGLEIDLSNYRGIWCIFSCLRKLFCSILNQLQRFLDHVIKLLDIPHKSQVGFLANNCIADHVLTLRNLIDKYGHGHQSICMLCGPQKNLNNSWAQHRPITSIKIGHVLVF